ncbi:MAG: hypothetical protein NTY77_06885 [Elusimicrobia bacterium]|nr:hypothetical protein [Elusimicrobiota bacterium]
MTRTESRRRGIFLLQTMVLVMIMGIVASGMLWLSFGRHVLLSRANESESSQHLASGVQSLVQACLEGTTYGITDCRVPHAAAACFPSSIAGKSVQVSSLGAPPNCQLSVTVNDK